MSQAVERLNGAQIVMRFIERQGIERVAGIPGGAALPLYDALSESSIEHILTRHEQGAGFLAQGMARVTGKLAVCMASSGPGATNLVTAIADAYMDSIPVLAITAQVPQALIGTDAFQECDTFGLMLPITKHNWMVRSVEELFEVMPEAIRLAMSGRPGPVSVDIPKDVQMQEMDITVWPDPVVADTHPQAQPEQIQTMLGMLAKAKRPVLMVGGGVIHSNCSEDLLRFAEQQQLPTVASFMGLGAMPTTHPLFLSMLGMHGSRATNMVLEECDLLIGAGVRFDDRATGKISEFCPNAAIIHVDVDASELGKLKTPVLAMQADIGSVLRAYLVDSQVIDRGDWLARVDELKRGFGWPDVGDCNVFHPHGLITRLGQLVGSESNVFTDVGQHQMWTAQLFPFSRPRQWSSSGGLGTMGFGLPAAIGAALAQPDRPVLCVSGDGSIMMNVQELDTAVEHNLNVKIVIMNNQNLGMVRQQQALFYGERFCAINNRRPVDFAALAQAMGACGVDLGKVDDPEAALAEALSTPGPCLINVPICEQEMVFPMVPPGAANIEMIGE